MLAPRQYSQLSLWSTQADIDAKCKELASLQAEQLSMKNVELCGLQEEMLQSPKGERKAAKERISVLDLEIAELSADQKKHSA